MKTTFTIDDAIGQCEAAAAALEKGYHDPDGNWCKCAAVAAENRQMAKWLRELKTYKEARVGCEYCKHKYRDPHERPCSLCKRNFVDMFERNVNADEEIEKGQKMKYEKCIEVLKERFRYTKTYKYTYEEIKEAQDMVIKLLENQIKPSPSKTQPKHSNWIPIKLREITEEERERKDYPEEWGVIYDCRLPDVGTDTLIQTKWGIDIAPFCEDERGAYWEQYETPGDVIAWQPLPEPYTEGSGEE